MAKNALGTSRLTCFHVTVMLWTRPWGKQRSRAKEDLLVMLHAVGLPLTWGDLGRVWPTKMLRVSGFDDVCLVVGTLVS